jgi:hypothetical protein
LWQVIRKLALPLELRHLADRIVDFILCDPQINFDGHTGIDLFIGAVLGRPHVVPLPD